MTMLLGEIQGECSLFVLKCVVDFSSAVIARQLDLIFVLIVEVTVVVDFESAAVSKVCFKFGMIKQDIPMILFCQFDAIAERSY